MNYPALRIYNYLGVLKKVKSKIYSLIIFGSPNYFLKGKNTQIYGYKTIFIGYGCHLMDNSSIKGTCDIGENVFIHENVLIRSFSYAISIGDNVTINKNTNVLGAVRIGNYVSIAPNVTIVGSNHVFSDKNKLIKEQGITSKGIIIEDDVWIAANCTILDGVTIGKGSVVAAGAVVNKDVPPYSVVGGVPAKILKSRLAN